MARRYAPGLLAILLLALSGSISWARMSEYRFSASSGTFQPLTSYSSALGSYNSISSTTGTFGDSATAGWYSIGFSFKFDCSYYSYFSINANGNMVLTNSTGNVRPAQRFDNLTGSRHYPIIAPFWQWQHLYSGSCMTTAVRYYRTGSSPNRVLTVEWQTQIATSSGHWWNGCTTSMLQYQVKLYEGSNKVEFHYGRVNNGGITTSATIGMAVSSSDFVSVTPGSTATASSTVVNNNIDLNNGYPTVGTVYTFDPSGETYTGLTGPGNGGTATAANGDTFLENFVEQVGNRSTYTPLSVAVACAAPAATYRFEITGAAASDYTIEPYASRSVNIYLSGGSFTPQIAFTPTRGGLRSATFRVTNTSTNVSRAYTLAASGTPRVVFTGNPAQGGTAAAADGDRFMTSIELPRLSQGTYQPLSIANTNAAPNYSAAPVSFTLSIDSSSQPSSQYWITDPSTGLPSSSVTVNVGAGETYVPEIQFTPLAAGQQFATLRITNGDGENRTYELAAFSIAPGGLFIANSAPLAGSTQFEKTLTCLGATPLSLAVRITSSGHGVPLVVNGVDIYQLDTTIRDGAPPYPLMRDAAGRPVALRDFIVTDQPLSDSWQATRTQYPITLQPGETRTVYFNFVGTYPGKRFVRAFVRSNAENFSGLDTAGTALAGLLSFEALPTSIGGRFVASEDGAPVRPVIFPQARLRSSSEATLVVFNTGLCDLRIGRRALEITDGDVLDFSVLSAFPNARVDATTGDYIIAPFTSDTITLRFAPTRPGTRMATLRVVTNDSTMILPGLTGRGETFIDLHGYGRASLEGRDVAFGPVVVGSSMAATASFENTVNSTLGVDAIYFEGGDVDQFIAQGWPGVPAYVVPGSKLNLGIVFTPAGEPGLRATTLVVVTSTGDTSRIAVRGEAGTQSVAVGPPSLFEDVAIQVGESRRQTVVITNTGTLPLRLERVEIVGADAGNYRLGSMPRLDIEPGASEYLEVTFAPTTQAQSSAELQVAVRGTVHTVALGGVGMRAWGGGDPSTEARSGGDLLAPGRGGPTKSATIR